MNIIDFYKNSFYSMKEREEDFCKKAKIYAEKQSIGHSDCLYEYILKTIKTSKFQENPEKYIRMWKEKRGCSEEFRIPEDLALSFFEKEMFYLKRLYKKQN